MAQPAQARLTIDLDALAHNLAVVRRDAGGAEVAPVVKADGYGLGAGAVARRLWAEGARSFFVAQLGEAEALREELGPARPATVYVLDGLTGGAGPRLLAAGLTPVLCTPAQITAARAWPDRPPVALQVDTGMNRQGVTPQDARDLAADLGGLQIGLVMSHLGSAAEPEDDRNAGQLERFRAVRALFPGSRASLAAAAGVVLGSEYGFDMVRPGITLYGGGPQETPDPRLRAVATLTAPILDIRLLAAGDRVGYGVGFTAQRVMRVAIVAAGYADGVIRAARGGGYAWFAGGRRDLVVVTMDLLAIDLDDAVAHVGDAVELLGANALLDDLAKAAATVSHEVLVRLSRRAQRVYLGEA
ncbi:alanine racemase [Phenylobacterium sp.]|uniref:alanine racemase n=1 Tax=Phenylobacterium sp. TaxID=1871053 RepID=UPI003982F46D